MCKCCPLQLTAGGSPILAMVHEPKQPHGQRPCAARESAYQGICRFVCCRPIVLAAVPPPVQIITPSSIRLTTS
jgi:hypothetical protein